MVGKLINYTIPFRGLKDGIHHYDFKVDNKFFENFEYSEIEESEVEVKLDLDKQSTLMVLMFKLSGRVVSICDRCLESLDLALDYEDKVIVKFGEEISDSRYIGEEVQLISHSDYEINVAQFIYEFIELSLPTRRIHPETEEGESGCNPEMLDVIEEYLVQEEKDEETDPRWDDLKKLLDNSKNK